MTDEKPDAEPKIDTDSVSDTVAGKTPDNHAAEASPELDAAESAIAAEEATARKEAADHDAGKATANHAREEPPVATPPPPPAAPARRGGRVIAWLALLVAILSGAGTAYLWNQNRVIGAQLESAQGSLGTASGAIDNALAAVRSVGDDLRATGERVERLESAQRNTTSLRDDLNDDIARNTGEIQRIEQTLTSMRGLSDNVRDTWVRAETEYFLQTANTSLQLGGDPDSALAALEAADDRLRGLGDPALTPVRRQLAQELAALRAMPRADVQGLALTLGSLASRVDLLPLSGGDRVDRFADDSERKAEGEKPLDRALSAIGGAVRGMLSVQKNDADIAPLLAPEERYFLYRNLELQLESARIAALRQDSANFRESLRSARRWLESHFDASDAGVISTLDTLAQLEGEDIQPPRPDISRSLRLLREARTESSE